jgi:ABC-type polysaccharide/polyol phosphate export permease
MLNNVNRAFDDTRRALKAWHVWLYIAWQDVISRYRRSIFGPLWVAGGMIATSLALSLTFGALSGQPLHNFLPFVMAGLLAWSHFVGVNFIESPELFVGVAGSIRNNAFPFMFYVFKFTAKQLILFAHNFVVFLIASAAVGNFHIPHWQFLPALVLLSLFMMFAGTVIGMVSARYRDLRFMLPYIAQILFFVTPVFWSPDTIHGSRSIIVNGNPLFHMMEILREPLLGKAASLHSWTVSIAMLIGAFVAWVATFSAFRRKIPFWV